MIRILLGLYKSFRFMTSFGILLIIFNLRRNNNAVYIIVGSNLHKVYKMNKFKEYNNITKINASK
jgi:hypothetical protein